MISPYSRLLFRTKSDLFLLAVCLSLICCSGCAKIQLAKHPPKQPAETQAPATSPTDQANEQVPSLTGYWQFGFQFQDKALQSSVHLEQNGNQFSGSGTDDQTNMAFDIDQGTIQGKQIRFFKKYTDGKSAPVEYTGAIQTLSDKDYQGPYLSGKYTNGSETNLWEAEKTQAPQQAAQPTPETGGGAGEPEQSQAPSSVPHHQFAPDKPPDISGKWMTAYEYNFKTIKSTVFLEQDGGRITGHGIDLNTSEKFIIDQGWYHYPKLTLIRKYPPTKPKKGKVMEPGRTMIFKAHIEIVTDKDYQGPYMSGKTQGGGNWEAQKVL